MIGATLILPGSVSACSPGRTRSGPRDRRSRSSGRIRTCHSCSQAKIADFGLREGGDADAGYSLPDDPKSIRSDFFSTAVIFHEMLTGSLPGWERNDLVPNERFFALPLEIQDLLARMLMARREAPGMPLDRVVEEIDGLLEGYEKTAVLEPEPAASDPGPERSSGPWRSA